jgi:predicted RNA-binding Zn-ribbon protein involved in translation (DUF1610 family)
MTFVIKRVPALVCPNCGEEYVDEKTSSDLLGAAEKAADSGVQVDIREYVTA